MGVGCQEFVGFENVMQGNLRDREGREQELEIQGSGFKA
jgi:hypothetical protein